MKSFRPNFPFMLFLLTSSMVFGATQCPGRVEPVRFHSLPHSHIGISIMVNGFGPYEFMVDTGAQIIVVDPALARELKLEARGTINMVTVARRGEVALVSAEEITVGPVSVKSLKLAVEDLGVIQADYPSLRGILGNNFLGRFDLLIDNGHRVLCFDDSDRMQKSLHGEHVPILASAALNSSSASAQAILVSVHLPDDSKRGSTLRLDSGSNVALLYTDRRGGVVALAQASPARGSTIGKQARFAYAYTPERNVKLGSQKEMQIAFAIPLGNGRLYSKTAEDGVLPTTLFKRVFISAADHFVMFDPR